MNTIYSQNSEMAKSSKLVFWTRFLSVFNKSVLLKNILTLLLFVVIGNGVYAQTTWYSLASGKWTNADIWTLDPAGAVPINPSGLYPNMSTDNIVIRTGITVSVPDGLTPFNSPVEIKNNLNCGILTVNGDLDFGVSSGHQFSEIRGNGRLYFESNNFPTANWNHFISAGLGGGTIVLRGSSFSFTGMPSTIYNLEINNAVTSNIYTLNQNLTIAGNLTISSGVFQINGTSTSVRNLTVNGNVTVNSNGKITTGTTATRVFHWMNVYGDFTNGGVVDLSNGVQYAEATTGAVKLKFLGLSDNNLVCNGATDLYRLFVDKGSDQTYSIAVNASSSANFKLFGPVSGTTNDATDGTYGWQRLPIVLNNGALKLESNVLISRLGENIGGNAPKEFTIPSSAQLTINGASVTTSTTTGDGKAITVYGKLKVDAGTFTTPLNTRGINYATDGIVTPVLEITGGDVYATQVRPYASSAKFHYRQTGGILHFNNRTDDHWSNSVFNLPQSTHIFEMSGGTIDFTIANTHSVTGIYINSADGNYSVTGGNVIVNIPSTNDFRICSTAPLYNFIVNGIGSSYKTLLTNLYGSDDTYFYGDLNVLNDLTIANNGVLDGRVYNLFVAGNMTVNSGSSFLQTAGSTAKLTFNGAKNSVLTNQNTTALSVGDFEIDKEIYSPSTQFYAVSLAGASGGITINDSLRVKRGKFDVVNYNINLKKNLEIVDGDLTSSGTGSIIMSGTALQTIKGAVAAEQNFGRFQLNSTSGVKLLSDINVTSVVFNANSLFDLDIYNLDVLTANYTSGSWSTSKMFKTSGKVSDGGLTLPIVLNANYGANTNVQLFPVGTFNVQGGSTLQYNPAYVDAKGILNSSGKITVIPVNDYHPTINPTRKTNATPYYWKASYEGLAGVTASNVRYRFTYSGTIKGTLGHIYNNYDWLEYSSAISGSTVSFPYSTVSLPTYLTEAYTIGDTKVFDKPRVLYSIKSGVFDDKNTWSETGHNGTATNKGPNAADYCIIGSKGATNHTVSSSTGGGAKSIIAAQIYIKGNSETGNTGTPPTLHVKSGTSGHIVDVIDGKGRLLFEDNSGSWEISNLITGNYRSFCNNSESIFEYAGTSGYRIAPLTKIPYYPNLYISGNTSNTKYSRNDGNLVVKGDLYVNDGLLTIDNYYNGVVTVGDSLKINSGTLTLSNQSTQNTFVEESIVFSGAGTLKTGNSGSENKLYLKGNITLVNNSTIDFSTSGRKTNVVFYGDNSVTVSRQGTGTANFYRIYINKPIAENVQFTLPFTLNGSTSDATKAIVLQSGQCHLNNSSLNLVLSSTGNPFKIPAGTTLKVDNGARVNVGSSTGNTGIWLDGSLVIDNGGKVYCNQGSGSYLDNYLEYTPSGAASIWLGDNSQLLVGSQLRRTTISDGGILQFTQAKASSIVTLGINSAPTSNRGVFEVLNAGSSFSQVESGSNITIVRGQSSASVPALLFSPATVSMATSSSFTMGNTSTPASQNMGLYSSVELMDLIIGSTNSPTVTIKTGDLQIGGSFTNGGTLNAAGYDLHIKGNFVNNGVYTPAGNTTWFSGSSDQFISGSSPLTFYNLTKINANTLTLGTASINVTNDFTVGVEASEALGGVVNTGGFDLNVARNLIVYGTTLSSGASKGVVCNGSSLQEVSGKATFTRLTINNSNGLDFPTQASAIHFTESLNLQSGVFNIGRNLITFDEDAVINATGGFSSSRMIQTNLSFTDNGIRKTLPQGSWTAEAPYTFLFPIGSAGKYTPIDLVVFANGNSSGSVRVKAANERHVSVVDDPLTLALNETQNVLQYNWTMDASGVTGFTGVAQMNFIDSDAFVTLPNDTSQYITSRILLNSTSWNKFDADDFDGNSKKLSFIFSNTNDSGIDGDYTAGISNCIPDDVSVYISVADNAPWNNASTWAIYNPLTQTVGAAGVGVPAGGPRGAVVYINTIVTMPTNFMAAYRTYINPSAVLATGSSFGHRLGDVNGTGTIQLESGNLPAGVYDHFFAVDGGTLDYSGTSLDYSILSEVTTLNNLRLSGSGERNFPNIGFTILGDFTIAGGDCKNPHNTNYSVKGDMVFSGGTFDANSATVTFNGTARQTISGANDFASPNEFYNLVVNNRVGVDLLNDIEVSNILTLTNGIVNSDAGGSLTLTNSLPSACAGGSSSAFVDGTLRKQINNSSSFHFPVGDETRYGLLAVTTNSSSQGIWEVKYFNHSPASDGLIAMQTPVQYVSANEYWSIKAPNTSCVANIETRWDDLSGINPDDASKLFVRYAETPLGWTQTASSFSGTVSSGLTTANSLLFSNFSGVNRVTYGANSIQAYTWTGSIDTDWFKTGNWSSDVVPSASSNTTIPDVANKPIITGSVVAQTNNLTIASNAKLTVNPGSKLTVGGNLTNSGVFEIQNTVSDLPSTMASVITNGAITQTGTTNVLTTLPLGVRYWYYGFSVNGSLLTANVWDVIQVSTLAYKYQNGWVKFVNNSEVLGNNPLNGYTVKLTGVGTKTLTATGTLNNTDLSMSLPANSWSLVANPYASSIDMSIVYDETSTSYGGSLIDPTIWVPTNATGSTAYATYNLVTGIGQNGGSKVLAPTQGFWIRNRATTPQLLSIVKSARVHSSTTSLKSASVSNEVADVFRIELVGATMVDEAVMLFREGGLENLSLNDSEKRLNSGANSCNLYTVKSEKSLAINMLPVIEAAYDVPLSILLGTSAAGTYTLKASNIMMFDSNIDVYLEDLLEGVTYNLRDISEIGVQLPVGSINDRFILHFSPSNKGVVTALPEFNGETVDEDVVIQQLDDDALVTFLGDIENDAHIELFAIGGQLLKVTRRVEKTTRVQLPKNHTVYIVRVVNGSKTHASRVVSLGK